MIWVFWKQHGRELAIGGAVVAIAVLFMTYEWSQMMDAIRQLGLESCQSGSLAGSKCNQALNAFESQFFGFSVIARYFLTALPALLAVFIAAPLLSREVEEGTYMFIWTQSITRSRWLTSKLLLLGACTLLVSALLSLFVLWWHVPLLYQDTAWTFYDVMGTAPVAYAAFALALGVAASAAIQRTIPAMAATLLLFVAARVAVYLVRPHFLAPLTLQLPAPSSVLGGIWQLGTTYPTVGLSETITYQPAARFWTFQYVESGIFVILTCLLLVLTVTFVRNRIR